MSAEEDRDIDDSVPTPRGEPLTDIGRQLSNTPAFSSYISEVYVGRQRQLNEQGKKTELTLQFFKVNSDGHPVFDDDGKIIVESVKTFRRRPMTVKQVQAIEDLRAQINKAPANSKAASDLMLKLYATLALWVFGINKEQFESCDFKELSFDMDAVFTNIISGVPLQAGSFTT